MKKHNITNATGELQWGGAFKEIGGKTVSFTSGKDPEFDFMLLESEILACKAHAKMLLKQGIISKEESKAIFAGLDELEGKSGGTAETQAKAEIEIAEDVHSTVLGFLEGKHGVKNLHCGRSRNDLVACDEKLFLKKQALEMQAALQKLVKTLAKKALENSGTTMPGYTHHQPALPTTFGHLMLSFAYAFKRDSKKFSQWIELHDTNPLGAGVGYGTTFPIDIQQTTSELGFAQSQENSLDAVSNRWEPQADFAYACVSAMTHLSILAQTLLIFSMKEVGFTSLKDKHSTGSSAMPQKKNPDSLEAIKAMTAKTQASLMQVVSAAKCNLAGYNKDLQWGKYEVLECAANAKTAVEIAAEIVDGLEVNKEKMGAESKAGFVGALSVAEQLKQDYGINFASAKKIVEKAVSEATAQGEHKITSAILNQLLDECKGESKGKTNSGIPLVPPVPTAHATPAISESELEKWQDPEWIISKTGESGPNPAHVSKKAGELLK